MTVKELLNELNRWVATDKSWLEANVILNIENDDSIRTSGIRFVAANDDGTISLEGEDE